MRTATAEARMHAAGFSVDSRPWLVHAAERLERDDHYADFTGWEAWMRESLPESEAECWWFEEDEDYLASIELYAAHCRMVERLP